MKPVEEKSKPVDDRHPDEIALENAKRPDPHHDYGTGSAPAAKKEK